MAASDVLRRLAAVARGEVADRGERYAAAVEAEALASDLDALLVEAAAAARTLDELAGARLVDPLLVARLREAVGRVAAEPKR